MKRSGIRPKRATPRRRQATREDWAWWQEIAMPKLLARSGGHCERCDRQLTPGVSVNRHHRARRQAGGDCLENLLLLCGTGTTGCHGWVTEHPTEAYANGWSVRALSNQDPADVPVRIRGRWWKLNPNGTKSLVP